jgi:type VI secretion system secreted protein VgrG
MATLTQAGRMLALTTPLGTDVLCIETLEGAEAVSDLFRFDLGLVSLTSATIAFKDIIGKRVTIAITLPQGQTRFINGLVSRFAFGGQDIGTGLNHYYAEVVPWLWVLTRTSDCRIFQKKTVPDIVQQIFKDLGFQDVRLNLQGTFEPREYCVQYRETDFQFVSRLLEEEGIFYFFEHTDSKHTLVLGNNPGAHVACPNQAKVRYRKAYGGATGEDMIRQWHAEQELHPGKYALTDYYFPTPSNNQMVKAVSAIKLEGSDKLEIYDYPGYFAKRFDGDPGASKVPTDADRTIKIRMAATEASHQVVQGAGECRAFLPGYSFTLSDHFRSDANGDYVLTRVVHKAANNLGRNEESHYHNSFTCLAKAVPLRPARVTPKPVIQGAQTALVVGLSGEEIDTDKYGRIKVQFFWDREGKKDANSSCWIRVATPWAGKNWGAIHIPRIGQEVIVSFLEGDPDQPIVTGSVYNAEQMPPYTLPDNKTQSGLKSRSSLKGTDANFNELRFEDKKGSEEVYFHAEKDFNRVVENNDTLKVGSSKADDGSQTIEIYKDRTETVKTGNETITVEKGNRVVTIKTGNETLTVETGNREVTIKTGNETLTVKTGNQTTTVEMGNQATTIKMGDQTTKVELGKIATEAMQSIELKVGQNSIKIDQMGITIAGLQIKLDAQLTAEIASQLSTKLASQLQTQVQGVMVQVSGSAMTQVSGAITMIG